MLLKSAQQQIEWGIRRLPDRFLLHYSDPNNWRLRHPTQHNCDPNWENGSYSICHKDVRGLTEIGTVIFDIVVDEKGKPVVRSAFKVSRTDGEKGSKKLYFDEFYFADNEPIPLQGPFIQYRKMKMQTYVKKYGDNSLWNRIVDTYTKYSKGDKPAKIDAESWNNMVTQACHKGERQKPMPQQKGKCT